MTSGIKSVAPTLYSFEADLSESFKVFTLHRLSSMLTAMVTGTGSPPRKLKISVAVYKPSLKSAVLSRRITLSSVLRSKKSWADSRV